MRTLLLKANKAISSDASLKELSEFDLASIKLEQYNDQITRDTTLEAYLRELPNPSKLFESGEIIYTFCMANGLGTCSVQDIERWLAGQDAESLGKLEANVIEVKITRDLVVPAAPIFFLVAVHILILLHRRRYELRQQLGTNLSNPVLNLFDESWIPYDRNRKSLAAFWHRVQSNVTLCFLIVGELVPLAAIGAVSYYIYRQVLLMAVIAGDFRDAMADFKESAKGIGVTDLPSLSPQAPGVASEYIYFGISAVCGIIVLVSLVQLIREQCREMVSAG